jgi:hypothetical protein
MSRGIFLFLLSALSSFAYADLPCLVIPFHAGESVEICDKSKAWFAGSDLSSMSDEQQQTFTRRREKIITLMAQQLRSQTKINLSKKKFKQTLDWVDKRLLKNAARITKCRQFSYCTGAGASGSFGFLVALVGGGAWGSVEYTYDFLTEEWKQNFVRDLELARMAYSPVPTIGAGIRMLVYFHDEEPGDREKVSVTYIPPLFIKYRGETSWGFGLHIGLSLPPGLSMLNATRFVTFRKRHPSAPACEQKLVETLNDFQTGKK